MYRIVILGIDGSRMVRDYNLSEEDAEVLAARLRLSLSPNRVTVEEE